MWQNHAVIFASFQEKLVPFWQPKREEKWVEGGWRGKVLHSGATRMFSEVVL